MIVFLLFFVTVGVIYAKPHGSAAMEKGNKERKIEMVVMQRQHASSNMSGENVAILLQNDFMKEQSTSNENKRVSWREDLRCGPNYPINGTAAECNPDGGYPCCSPKDWCGKTDKHCKCDDCIDYSTAPWPSVTGHCLKDPWKTTYPCDHGHRVGCDKESLMGKGYCWRSCIRSSILAAHINVFWKDEDIGYEYPRNKKWEYLPCTTDMECIEKKAGLWRGGKRCYVRGIAAPLEVNKN